MLIESTSQYFVKKELTGSGKLTTTGPVSTIGLLYLLRSLTSTAIVVPIFIGGKNSNSAGIVPWYTLLSST